MKRIYTEAQKVKAQLDRAKGEHRIADLTIEQWEKALVYFGNKCAYCDGNYEYLEHYIPLSRGGGTTASNCVPACAKCNARKDAQSVQNLNVYAKGRVIRYLRSLGAKIVFHVHKFDVRESKEYRHEWEVICSTCKYHDSTFYSKSDAEYRAKLANRSVCNVSLEGVNWSSRFTPDGQPLESWTEIAEKLTREQTERINA
jgi:hypothetical protein